MTSDQIFVGRQPIYNRSLDTYAYELLFRDGHQNRANVFDGDKATSQVILNTFLDIGFEKVVGSSKAFLNLTRSYIDGSIQLPFTNSQVVLEVLEDVPPEPEIIAGLQELSKRGYTLALDDFVYDQALQPFIDLADIIKIDIQSFSASELQQHVTQLQGSGVKLLAEKIETQQEFERCKSLGFDFFQGYFLSKPEIIIGKKPPQNKLTALELLSRLQAPDVELHELEKIVSKDAALTYRVLKFINSPVSGISTEVSSIKHALLMLGIDTLKSWVSLIVFSGLSEKPAEVMRTALVRAKACESVALSLAQENGEEYFIVGLFSVLDAILDVPMDELLQPLKLSEEITQALINSSGDLGRVLDSVIAYEQADWDSKIFADFNLTQFRKDYMSSIAWADESMKSIMK